MCPGSTEHHSRLATIVVADIVGYSMLMSADEEGTYTTLRTIRTDIIEPLVMAGDGRIVKHLGDGFLAEFPAVLKAVQFAQSLQDELRSRNTGIPDEQRVRFRVGINLGDIIIDDDGDVFGDGVNVAARLESLAPPGGICVSGVIHDLVHKNISARFEDLGDQSVKNIPSPVRAYCLNVGGATQSSAESRSRMRRRSVFGELKRRNVIRVAIAYLAAAWLLTEVASTLFPIFGVPEWGVRFIVILFALGFLPTLVFSWVYEITPEGLKRETEVVKDGSSASLAAKRLDWMTMAVIILALAWVVADRFWLSPTRVVESVTDQAITLDQSSDSGSGASTYPADSIAVLPFVNMSDDAANEYFSDGIAEELLNLLANIPELRVVARTSSFSFKGKDVKIADIARELNVAHILEGSVRKSGNQVRITAQLVRSADSSHLWSATYDRTLDNIFAIQDEIAASVVNELKGTLLEGAAPKSESTVPEAFELYLQGRHLNDRYTQEAFENAEQLLKEAIAIDPAFAPAWRQLGIAYWFQEEYSLPVSVARKLAQDAFERALSLDPSNASVYASLSLLARSNFDYSAADDYLQKALQLKDNSGFPYSAAASLFRTFGRLDKSIGLAEKSIAYNPIDAGTYRNLGYSCYYANRLNEAVAAFRKAISLNPDNYRSYLYLGRTLLAQGVETEAIEMIRKVSDRRFKLAGLAMAHHAMGDSAASDQALSELTEIASHVMAFQIAEVHAFRGDNDSAFEWLDVALETRDAGLNVLLGNPVFDDLTSDARYDSLLEKLGLSQYWQAMNLN